MATMDDKLAQTDPNARIHPTTVYRLQGIPATTGSKSTTKNDVRALIEKTWPLLQGTDISIRVLEADPHDAGQMIATLNFTDKNNPVEAAIMSADVLICGEDGSKDTTHTCLRLTSDFLTETQRTGLQYLSSPLQNHRESEIELSSGACDWILQHEAFNDWLSTPHKLLYIRGAPGSGKSTVMKRIGQHLKETQSSDGRLILSHFFGSRKDDIWESQSRYYRHLLTQMLPHEPRYLDEIARRTESLRNDDDWGLFAGFLQCYCMGILPEMMRKVPITILVDGTDESVGFSINELQGLLKTAERTKSDLKICVSLPSVQRYTPKPDFTIYVEAHNHGDVRKVVHEKLENSEDGDQEEMDTIELEEEIQQKANRSFLWAVLVTKDMARLRRSGENILALRKELSDYPPDLERLFSHLIGTIDVDARPEMANMFQWLCFAKQPLSLEELQHVLALDEEAASTSLEELRSSSKFMGIQDIRRGIENQSRGLIEVKDYQDPNKSDNLTSRVQFVHSDMLDYLLLRGGLQSFIQVRAPREWDSSFPPPTTANLLPTPSPPQIAKACIRYLKMREIVEETRKNLDFAEMMLEAGIKLRTGGPLTSNESLDLWTKMRTAAEVWNLVLDTDYQAEGIGGTRPSESKSRIENGFSRLARSISQRTVDKFPFANYVVNSLDHHLDSLEKSGTSCVDLIKFQIQNPEQHNTFHSWRYLSLCLRLANLPASPFDPPSRDPTPPRHTTPLHYIARHNLLSSLKPALSSTLQPSLSLHDGAGATPLITAIQNSHYALARTLITTAPIDPNIPDTTPGQHWPPLTHALCRYTWKKHENYNYNGDDDDSSEEPQPNDLHALVTALLTHPAIDPSARDADSRTPLHHAAERGYVDAMTLLLKNRSDVVGVDVADARGRTPLHYAAASPEPRAALLLLDHHHHTHAATTGTRAAGAVVVRLDAPDAGGRTPLSYAAERGAVTVVRKLLSAAAATPPPPPSSSSSSTSASVDVRRVDAAGVGALGYAIKGGHADVVRALVKAGAGREGLTVGMKEVSLLEWAVGTGEVVLVKGVLEREGGDVYADEALLRRVREMAGERQWFDGGFRWARIEGAADPVEDAREWIRENLYRFEQKSGNLGEIKRLMEERKRSRERKEKEMVARKNQGPGGKITSRL